MELPCAVKFSSLKIVATPKVGVRTRSGVDPLDECAELPQIWTESGQREY